MMAVACGMPDPQLGVALRLSGYLDCQARALGENGFQALAGGPIIAGLLSGLLTIFVALIGYRLILGGTPALRDGVTWAVRVGVVLALATGWPAFQTLIYRVAVDAPGELAGVILPASGLSGEALDARVQQAYDTIRLGSAVEQAGEAVPPAATSPQAGQPVPQQAPQFATSALPPLPQTASVMVLSTVGITAALRVAIGFLLAVGPLALMALLFDATLGLFSGWVRALAGTALASLAATVVTAIDLVMVEGELARLQSYAAGGLVAAVDPQAITTLVLVFALIMLVAILTGFRMAGAFRLPAIGSPFFTARDGRISSTARIGTSGARPLLAARTAEPTIAPPSRVSSVADALAATVRREQGTAIAVAAGASSNRTTVLQGTARQDVASAAVPLGVAGRRSIGRRSLSAASRDRMA